MTSTQPDWPLDDAAAWRDRAQERLRARPDLMGGLIDMTFVPAAVAQADSYFGYMMASAGAPPVEDLTAAWICLNAKRSLATAVKIAAVIFNLPAPDGPTPGA